ncbi:hypothetical protein A3709_03555 [Halioglobus sp. HI00S01]|uniref:DUF6316 family protein n=1 Tax=Halioglobus sp. HI00S01 TaxID=1822214 RepID=UPI0007C25E26|nr:DUF6316 family protein [Halioglobus sp. HI00S01]KZX56867.1 hypothetical protein A3709_03555 [Halioglobus sp. HI00S01]
MTERRKSDQEEKSFFRSDRFFEHNGQWFFATREGTTEGPFGDRIQAQARLEAYIKVANSGILGDGTTDDHAATPGHSDWSLKPK